MLLQAAVVVATIWVFYGCRYSAFNSPPAPGNEGFYWHWGETVQKAGVLGEALRLARDYRLLPEAYLIGMASTYHTLNSMPAFLNGQHMRDGLVVLLSLRLSREDAVARLRIAPSGMRRRVEVAKPRGGWVAHFLPIHLAGVLQYRAFVDSSGHLLDRGSQQQIQRRNRQILPVYPSIFILAGAASYWFRGRVRQQRIMSAAVFTCMLLLVGECFAMYPDYLAYFNRIAGGPTQGYKHLVDSSLDWGQDLPGLKSWLEQDDRNSPYKTPVYLAYFGASDPAYYHIRATELWSEKPHRPVSLGAGVYCISAYGTPTPLPASAGRMESELRRRLPANASVHPANGRRRSGHTVEACPIERQGFFWEASNQVRGTLRRPLVLAASTA